MIDPAGGDAERRFLTAGDGMRLHCLHWRSRPSTNVLEFQPAAEDRAPEGRELLRVDQLEVGQRYFVYVTNGSGLYRSEMNDIVEVTSHDQQTPRIRFVQKGKGVVSFTGEKLYEVQVIAAVDKALAALRYGPPIIRVVRPGEFDRYRRRMVETGQRADGQFKVLRLTSDTSFIPAVANGFTAARRHVGPGMELGVRLSAGGHCVLASEVEGDASTRIRATWRRSPRRHGSYPAGWDCRATHHQRVVSLDKPQLS